MRSDGTFVGPCLVVKESRFVDGDDKAIEFHRVFCETQTLAQQCADAFNIQLSTVERTSGFVANSIPRVNFLQSSVYVLRIREEVLGRPTWKISGTCMGET